MIKEAGGVACRNSDNYTVGDRGDRWQHPLDKELLAVLEHSYATCFLRDLLLSTIFSLSPLYIF